MKENEFELLATLLRSHGNVRLAAKAVLLEGIGPAEAARRFDILHPQSVTNSHKRFQSTHRKIEAVYRPTGVDANNSAKQVLSDQQRINELEIALQGCVDYLKRLPAVPETLLQVRKFEEVLSKDSATSIPKLSGGSYTDAGAPVVRVNIVGDKATVSTGMPANLEHSLWEILTSGVEVELK
ncbi:hypothetical protein GCM10027277_57810 [Pseudoduganella ginsengisoli]|uniref:Uncharacterized protein n=1 Tax=Pseudoduganella ginsengisoli TaxID=1462440 RepID=A0A6L6Q9P0_9BURK|nr:hypothetical protein [Pseudoduganella ginsengisoli]MTW05911.1 hypothetical protein [Pseudoduganella ginsengisoli]